MCVGGGGGQDNSAAEARRREEARQARITEGRTAIDEAFNIFDNSYFDDYGTTYRDYYYPQLDDQFQDAQKQLTLGLATTGNATSSAGLEKRRKLSEFYNDQRSLVENQALGAINGLRTNIERNRSDLYAQNNVAADPGNAAASAARNVSVLNQGPELTPLSDVFANIIGNLNNHNVARQRSGTDTNSQRNGTTLFLGNGAGGSSGFVVS